MDFGVFTKEGAKKVLEGQSDLRACLPLVIPSVQGPIVQGKYQHDRSVLFC